MTDQTSIKAIYERAEQFKKEDMAMVHLEANTNSSSNMINLFVGDPVIAVELMSAMLEEIADKTNATYEAMLGALMIAHNGGYATKNNNSSTIC